MSEINILLVDSDTNSLLQTSNLLRNHTYKVTTLQEASVAASMLSAGSAEFDLLMIGVNSSNVEEYKLFHSAVKMVPVVILMSDDANRTLEKYAIEDGAYLFLQKPVCMDVIKYLWQHVFREKMLKIKEKGNFNEVVHNNNTPKDDQPTRSILKCNGSSRQGSGIEETTDHSDSGNTIIAKKSKMCTEWTLDLHRMFINAVTILGEGRCFPKEILQLMNVPGLTRMQVASHLQKCRLGWQPAAERKPRRRGSRASNSNASNRTKKYGLFPLKMKGSHSRLAENPNKNGEHVQVEVQSATSQNTGDFFPISQSNDKNGYSRGKEIAATLNHENQLFDLIPIESEVDCNQVVTGIDFKAQDIDWDKVDQLQVPDTDNVVADDEFWNSWIAGFTDQPWTGAL